jgi:RNA polymerase sigma-70 factor (ECF subfamily)
MEATRRKAIHDAMVRLSDGDRGAFDVLVDALWPVVLSFAERSMGRSVDAEDVAQETFYRICSRIADFDRTRDGLAWAFGIARYEIMTHRKRAQRRREVQDDTSLSILPHDGGTQEDTLIEREASAALERAAGALTGEDRQLLGLAPGLAAAGPMSPTVRKRKQRALERLRGLWRSFYGHP